MRIELELPEERVAELKVLMEKTGLTTYKGLFNNSLTLLEWSVNQIKDGRAIISQKDGEEFCRELDMPILTNIKK